MLIIFSDFYAMHFSMHYINGIHRLEWQLFMIYTCRASMIWIIGEYAERIDNADELLESFLEGFQDENSQVRKIVDKLLI